MRSRTLGLFIVIAVLVAGLGIAFFAPRTRPQASAGTSGLPETVDLAGALRDFREAHPDFAVTPTGGFGNYVGLVGETLGSKKMVYDGDGHKVLTPAADAAGRRIAPFLANRETTCGITDFEIIDGKVIPGAPFAARFSVLGAAITSSGVDIPVTMQTRVGSDVYAPFGPYNDPDGGDVNDNANPRHAILPDIYPAGTPITIAGQSWKDGSRHIEADSNQASPSVLVLRDGSPAPDIEPFEDQTAAVDFVRDFIDTTTNKMTLASNQAIFLFEIGVTDLSSAAADFQDLVVVVTLARRTEDLIGPGEVVPLPGTDTLAVLDPTSDAGGISTATSFGQWFRDQIGVNMSKVETITLALQSDDTYLYDDQLDPRFSGAGGFYPIDDQLLGNESNSHNEHFTYQLSAKFVYDANADQYVTFTGDGDAWLFVDDQLGIDLGGIHGVMDQRLDVNRLCLVHGDTYWARLFIAQRSSLGSRLRLETNILFTQSGVPSVSNQYD